MLELLLDGLFILAAAVVRLLRLFILAGAVLRLFGLFILRLSGFFLIIL
jgi:hypothetical protein